MNSLNKIQVIGNLTREPELRHTKTGNAVSTVGVATNRKWKDASGVLQDEAEYHNVVLWGRVAEIACQYLKKGSKVYFSGRLKTRTWEDESGHKNYRTEIIAEDMIMLSKLNENGGTTPVKAVKNDNEYAELPELDIDGMGIETDMPF